MKIIACLFLVVAVTTAWELPKEFNTCKRSDPEFTRCIIDAVTVALRAVGNGIRSLKIPPMEPLRIESMKIGKSQGPVSLAQEYKNIVVSGIVKDIEILNYTMNFDDLIFRADSRVPELSFVADYALDGKILVLPIRGVGKCNVTFHDVFSHHESYNEKYEKNGVIYLRTTKYKFKLRPRKIFFRFDNLFNGDTLLEEQMNKFLNENADLIFKELQSSYEETFGVVFAQMSNMVYDKIPFDTLFPL